MYLVILKMKFSKARNYLCANERGEWFISRAKSRAVKFSTQEEAQAAAQNVHHRDVVGLSFDHA